LGVVCFTKIFNINIFANPPTAINLFPIGKRG
jgi:hypothetical protein